MNIFICFAHFERSIHIALPQTTLSPDFQCYYYHVPDHQPNHWLLPTKWHRCTPPVISPSEQNQQPVTLLSFVHSKNFLLPLSFRNALESLVQNARISSSGIPWFCYKILSVDKWVPFMLPSLMSFTLSQLIVGINHTKILS